MPRRPPHGDPPIRPTLAMVARSAGVSAPTASKVLNGRADVSAETRARVERALHDLQYSPPTGRSRSEERIVEIVFDDLLNPYSAEVYDGAAEAGLAAGVTVVPRRRADDSDSDWARRLKRSGRHGVVVVTSVLTPQQISRFERVGLPMVVIDAINPPRAEITSIGSTNFTGGLTATQHLLDLGHRRIGHITGPLTLACSVARLHGYRAALENAGLPSTDALVGTGPFTYESGVSFASAWLTGAEPPTAVFAGSDQMAFGVIEAARLHGLRVPDDLSVVGYDDTFAAHTSSPPLTCVHQPLRQMGALAIETLLRIGAGEAVASHHMELATYLQVRASTAAPQSA